MVDLREEMQEWEKAAGRITRQSGVHGGREVAALSWLVDFAQTKLDELSAGQRADTTWEARRFAFDGGLVHTIDNLQTEATMIKGEEIGVDSMEYNPILTLEQLQQVVRAALESFITGSATFDNISGSITARHPKMRGYRRISFKGGFESCFYFVASQLLNRGGDRIRICKGCARLAIMSRRDKEFCTQACQIASWKRDNPKRPKKRKATKGGKRHGTKK
jgi:hypothetical protein